MNYRLSPSDLTFLYTGCKRCFYQKVANGISQPSTPLPSIFSKIAGLLKDYYDGKRTSQLHVDIPPGIITPGEIWAHSDRPLNTPDDLVGLKMRVAGDGGEILSRMGVATVHLLLLVSFIEPN